MAEIRLATRLPPAPRQTFAVYRLKQPAVSERSIRALAKTLGMHVDPRRATLSADARKLTLSSGMFELRMHRASGAFRLIDRSRWQADDGKANLKMADAVAARLAQTVVKRLGLDGGDRFRVQKVARLRVGAISLEGEKTPERTIDVAVALQRVIDKLPVDGPGGKIILYFDAKGEPTGMERSCRPLGAALARKVTLCSPKDAIEQLARHYRAVRTILTVQDVSLAYFEQGARDTQQTLQPAYVIRGVIGAENDPVRRKLVYVAQAIDGEGQPLTPPLARKPSQPARPAKPRGRPAPRAKSRA